MKRILGDEYQAFLDSYEETRKYGLRVNTLKITPEEFEKISPFHLSPVPWIPGAYTYLEEDHASSHPFYFAGLYYLQEPSAMTPASVLDVEPGDKVLDLCAAPGGKSTALGAKLKGKGLLVANDISASRCKALLKNIEVFGIPNSFVTNEIPGKLTERFAEFFDKVLVDAPCSGEGMFRKDEGAVRAWYPEKPAECAKIQRDIILNAADMLRPGGHLLYSTCTFAPEEDEEVIAFLLEQRPDMHLMKVPAREGFSEGLNGLTDCVRLWPHKTGGEGHFLAMLEKDDPMKLYAAAPVKEAVSAVEEGAPAEVIEELPMEENTGRKKMKAKDRREALKSQKARQKGRGGKNDERVSGQSDQMTVLQEFLQNMNKKMEIERIQIRSGQVYYDTGLLPDVAGLTFLRNGLYLGEIKKDRFEPGQSFAMTLNMEDYKDIVNLAADDDRIPRYLRGESIPVTSEEAGETNGWRLLCAGGYPLGWARLTGSILKNKYHPGWRSKY